MTPRDPARVATPDAEAGARVYALCRNPAGAAELAEAAAAAPPGSVSLHAHDQDSAESCAAVATEFAGVPLDKCHNKCDRSAMFLIEIDSNDDTV